MTVVCNPKVSRAVLSTTLFVFLCMVSSVVFSQPSTTQSNVTFSTGLSYNLDSENTGSYQNRERSVSVPYSLKVELTPSISVTVRTSSASASNEFIASTGVVSTSSSAQSNPELSLTYRRSSAPSSKWPSLSLNGGVELLASGVSVSSGESEESRVGSIGFTVGWPLISINGRVELPIVESGGSSDAEFSIVYSGVRSASVGVELERQFLPVVISASGNVGYSGEYDFIYVDVDELTISPGLNYSLEFGAKLFVNEEITYISSVGVDIVKDVRVNNSVVNGSGSESVSLDLGLLYAIDRSRSIVPSLNIDITESGRSSTLSFIYTHRF